MHDTAACVALVHVVCPSSIKPLSHTIVGAVCACMHASRYKQHKRCQSTSLQGWFRFNRSKHSCVHACLLPQEGVAPDVPETSSLYPQCLATRNLLTDLELLSHADYFVGTQKSGLSPIIEVGNTPAYSPEILYS